MMHGQKNFKLEEYSLFTLNQIILRRGMSM